MSIELVTNFRCPPLNFINLQVFREVPTSHFHKPTCFYGFLSECCRMLQIWKVNYLWCLRMLQQRSCKNRLFPRFWVVPKSKKVVRTLHLRFILKLKLELFSMLQIQRENDLSWLRMLEQRSLAKIGYFLIFSKCCIQVRLDLFFMLQIHYLCCLRILQLKIVWIIHLDNFKKFQVASKSQRATISLELFHAWNMLQTRNCV